MRRLFAIIVSLFMLTCSMVGQEVVEERVVPKDSLPDLWIVTIDMSGSMTGSSVQPNLAYVPDSLDVLVSAFGNNEKDRFVLFSSGAEKNDLLRAGRNQKTYSDKELINYLIHEKNLTPVGFSFIRNAIQKICNNSSGFSYDMSFTSLVRPLTIYSLAKVKEFDFLPYGRVYHVLVTDDGDINDQWMQDYKWMKKWARKHFLCFNDILPTVASSEYDFTSRKSGKFIEKKAFDKKQPHVYLTQYVTFQEANPDCLVALDSLFEVVELRDDRLKLQMGPCGDSVKLMYVASCKINGHLVEVNQYLYRSDTIEVAFDKSFVNTFHNTVFVSGSYQELYRDCVLGLRYRVVPREGELPQKYITSETRAVEMKLIGALVIALLLALLFVLMWQNSVVLKIFVEGKCYKVKGKVFSKMKHGKCNLMTLVCKDDRIQRVFFYKGKGVSVEDDASVARGDWGAQIYTIQKIELSGAASSCRKGIYYVNKFICVDKDIELRYSKNLVLFIRLIQEHARNQSFDTNPIQRRNLEMLAHYYEERSEEILPVCNNAMVNVIKGGAIDEGCSHDYLALNIFDLNCQQSADRIYLRYSLMFLLKDKTVIGAVIQKLLNLARYILENERQEFGYFDKKAYDDNDQLRSDILVRASAMLNYVYLKNGEKKRMVYSPFDGEHIEPFSKKIRTGRGVVSIAHSPIRTSWMCNEVSRTSYRLRNLITFLGNDKIEILDEEQDLSYGHLLCNGMESGAYYALDLDEFFSVITKTIK